MEPKDYLKANPRVDRDTFVSTYKGKDYNEAALIKMYDNWQTAYRSSGSETSSPTKGAKSIMEAATSILKGQEGGGYYKDIKDSVNSSQTMDLVTQDGKILPADQIAQNVFKAGIGQISDEYNNQRKLLEDINTKTGLTGKLSKDFREEISNAGPRLAQLGISFETLAGVAQGLVEKSGKFNLINQQSFEQAAKVGQAYLGSMSELTNMLPDFEKVGIGAKGTFDAVEKAGKSSLTLGLNSQRVSKDLATNIGKLNEYGFQKGVEGLARMVQKSIEFRLSMDAVSQVAEKVFSPESALELSANLQVLGGAIGDFNDPLKLMYMATNNVEGLQDSIINAASSLATYNQEQGRFEVTGVNLRKVREMATALGMDYKELTKTAVAAQERLSAKEMLSGLRIEDEDKEFLTNMSQMKNGKMTIELQSEKMRDLFGGAQEVALDTLDKNQAELLLKYKDEFKKLEADDIVRGQASDIENIRRDVSFLVKSIALTGTREVKELADKMGIDMKKFAETTKEALPKAATLINNEIKGIITPDNKQTGKVETPKNAITKEEATKIAEEEAKKQKEASTQTDKNVKVTNEYVFKGGDALVDGWMREVGKNSSIYNDFHTVDTQSYTTPSTAKR
jgi:hypothetical protein